MEQMAEGGEISFFGEVRRVRQAGQGGHAVHRGIKNQFGPLCRTGVFERLGFEAAGDDEIRSFFDDREWRAGGLEGTDPGWSVEFILHVCVTVARAAHESGGAEDVTVREGSDDFFTPDSVLSGEDGSVIEAATHQAK